MGRIFLIMKIQLTPGVHLSLPCGNIHIYDQNNQTSLLIYIYPRSQVSVYRPIGPLVRILLTMLTIKWLLSMQKS